ncbi:MAG: hypothetical protein IJY59_04055 [Bacteroidaceae bacterium]|nr:hypothetical protein [Bacteroidaceae bacterium]
MGKSAYKISYYVLYALFAIIGVVLVLFYGVGFDTTNAAGLTEPQYTDALIYLKYALVAITVALAVIAGLAQFVASLKDNPKGAVKTVVALIALVAVVAISYGMGSTEPIMVNGEPYNDTFWLKVTDMFIYSMYILGVIAAIAALVNMTGIFKR